MHKILGSIQLPGDKSISHRAALFSALRAGEAKFHNFNFNQDCSATLACLMQLGIEWKYEQDVLTIRGKHIYDWSKPPVPLDAKNSGTTARLISGILANLDFQTTLTGDYSLCKRPMERIITPLQQMGADINSENGFLPLKFIPVKRLKAIKYKLLIASAQVKSSLLLAGLFAEGNTEVIETASTRDHTERMLQLRTKKNTDRTFSIFSSSEVELRDLSMTIPGDFSSAAFFLCAALMLPGSDLVINNVSINPTRTGLLEVLKIMGANPGFEIISKFPEPAGRITVKCEKLTNCPIPQSLIANIIDEIPILAILATQAEGEFVLRNAKELRFKESDRISMMVNNLRAVGVEVQEFDDGFQFCGPVEIKGGKIKTNGDHRIAMAFAIANLLTEEEIIIDDPDCVSVSFPSFWDLLNDLT